MKDFTWGVAAASYQIEGRLPDDGRGKCVWDMFCEQPGRVRNGHNGQRACMHLAHYRDDVNMMADLGVQAYRLSISWPRVIPTGTGQINRKGLDFYDQLIDALLDKHIQPWVTLFHWDYPYALFLKGGWLNPDSPKWFADYAQVIVDKLSDRVSHWMTQNEPQCTFYFGHQTAFFAPGLQLGIREVLTGAHHSLLAHGLATQVIRSHAKLPSIVGAAPVGNVTVPVTGSSENIAAAKAHTFAMTEKTMWSNTWFADPMILGHYPEDGLELFGADMPEIGSDDMKIIHQPLDFYGTNIYTAQRIDVQNGEAEIINPIDGDSFTAMDWLVEPNCLYWASKFYYERYKLPLVFTESGMANLDWPDENGEVKDPQRIDYLKRHIGAVQQAQSEGIPVDGYFVWSIMDNFEWPFGYDRRFGLVYIDYVTQKRIPKASAHWYRDFIRSQI